MRRSHRERLAACAWKAFNTLRIPSKASPAGSEGTARTAAEPQASEAFVKASRALLVWSGARSELCGGHPRGRASATDSRLDGFVASFIARAWWPDFRFGAIV